MKRSIRAFIVHVVPYSETSLLVRAYSPEIGFFHGVFKGGRKAKGSAVRASSVGEFTTTFRNSDLHTLYDYKAINYFHSLSDDFTKTSIAVFLCDVLERCLRQESPSEKLYNYLINSFEILNILNEPANFHIQFILNLTQILGVGAKNNYSSEKLYFDPAESGYIATPGSHSLSQHESSFLHLMQNADFAEGSQLKVTNEVRRKILVVLIHHLIFHIPQFGRIKSLDVMEELFSS